VSDGQHAAIVSLSERERSTLAELGEKLAHWLANPAHLTREDWALLAPIALRLHDLLRRLDK